MAIAMMVASAVVSAGAFTGGAEISRAVHKGDYDRSNAETEQKRHNLALEKFNKDQIAYKRHRDEIYDFLQKQKIIQNLAKSDFEMTDDNLQLYKMYHPDHPDINIDLNKKPVFSDYYQPSDEMKKYQYIFFVGGMMISVFLLKRYKKIVIYQ